jgi:hypothetical protein
MGLGMSGFNIDGYVTVPERIALFYKRYPEGSLQMDAPEFVQVDGKQWVIGRAYAYRTPDDQRPGIGTAWEVIPGTTPFTRGSEIMNLESSAWGRCIGSLGIGIDKSIATYDEIEAARTRNTTPLAGGFIVKTTEAIPDDPWQTQTDTPAPSYKAPTKGSSMYPATPGQVKAIHAILGKQGTRDDLDKLAAVNAWLTSMNKEPVTAISEVNKHDASGLIDSLQTPP